MKIKEISDNKRNLISCRTLASFHRHLTAELSIRMIRGCEVTRWRYIIHCTLNFTLNDIVTRLEAFIAVTRIRTKCNNRQINKVIKLEIKLTLMFCSTT